MADACLQGLRLALLGPGKVGSSLARWAAAAGAELLVVAGGRGGAAAALAADLGGRTVAAETLASADADLLLVAVPDPRLDAAAAALAGRPQAPVVLHTSGVRDAEALAPLRAGGSAVGSCHPLRAFPAVLADPAAARGIAFGVDGDPPARLVAARLAECFGGVAVEVPAALRPLYHFAATLAAGGVVTLVAAAGDLAARLGLPAAVARGYLELARGALDAAAAAPEPGDALTGPAARGDAAVLRSHLLALGVHAPELVPLALGLARETLRQVARRGPLDAEQEALREALADRPVRPFLDP